MRLEIDVHIGYSWQKYLTPVWLVTCEYYITQSGPSSGCGRPTNDDTTPSYFSRSLTPLLINVGMFCNTRVAHLASFAPLYCASTRDQHYRSVFDPEYTTHINRVSVFYSTAQLKQYHNITKVSSKSVSALSYFI